MAGNQGRRGWDILARDVTGSVSVEATALLGIAVLGLAGLSTLGGAMGTAIGGDARGPATANHAAMVVSRQAGAAEGAARFAEELAAARKAMGPEVSARLTKMGREVSQREQIISRLDPTSLSEVAKVLGDDFEGFSQRIRQNVGKEGGLTPAEAHYWLGGGPRTGGAPKAVVENPTPLGLAPMTDALRAQVSERLSRLTNYGRAGIHYDVSAFPTEGFGYLTDLANAIKGEGVLADVIQELGIRVGIVDFSKWDPDLAHLRFITTGDGIFANVGKSAAYNRERILAHVRNFAEEALDMDEVGPHPRGGALPEKAPATRESIARVSPEKVQAAMAWKWAGELPGLMGDFFPRRDGASAVLWNYADPLQGGSGKMVEISAQQVASRAGSDPRYALLEQGDVAAYLETNGYGVQAEKLRASGKEVRVDAISFTRMDNVLGRFGVDAYTLKGKGAVVDEKGARIYLNLDPDTAPWSQMLAAFVEGVTETKGKP